MKCPICNQDLERVGKIKEGIVYFCHKCNEKGTKNNLKTRQIWIDTKPSLSEYKLVRTGIMFK